MGKFRELTVEPGTLINGDHLDKMFEAQIEILDHYVKLEGLPPFPFGDFNDKKNQTLLKDFCGRFTEELGEAFQAYNQLCTLVYHPSTEEGKAFKGIDTKEFKLTLKDFNEEVADAMHFLLELCIFCNFTDLDIKELTMKALQADGFEPGSNTRYDTLDLLFQLARNYHIRNGIKPAASQIGYSIPYVCLISKGGNNINQYLLDESHTFLWKTTYWVQMFKNSLKNKPWKQTQVETDENQTRFALFQVVAHFFIYLDLVGFDKESVYAGYMTKNKINQSRIENKY